MDELMKRATQPMTAPYPQFSALCRDGVWELTIMGLHSPLTLLGTPRSMSFASLDRLAQYLVSRKVPKPKEPVAA